MSSSSEEPLIRRMLDVGRELMTDVDLDAVLDRSLPAIRERPRAGGLDVLGRER